MKDLLGDTVECVEYDLGNHIISIVHKDGSKIPLAIVGYATTEQCQFIADAINEKLEKDKQDITELRNKFFKECTIRLSGGHYKVDLAPHDLFEWIKRETK